MSQKSYSEAGDYLWRGGQKLKITKDPSHFTARLKRGKNAEMVAHDYAVSKGAQLTRQNLNEFAVDPQECDAAMDRLRKGSDVEFVSHVYSIEGDSASRVMLTNEIVVKFDPTISDERIERLMEEFGLSLLKPVRGEPRTYVLALNAQAQKNPIKIVNELHSREEVLYCEANVTVKATTKFIPTDTGFAHQWHLHHTGGPGLSETPSLSHVDAVRAWDLGRGERGIIVAVADDSVDLNHIDFQGEGKIVSPRDFGGDDFDPLPEEPTDNHGTACAGVAVAEENGQGVVGAAPGCALMPIRTSGWIDDNSIDALFDWAVDQGAAVMSCSWGVDARAFPLSLQMRNALTRAATEGRDGKGIVIVFAGGNSNRPVNGTVNESGWPQNTLNGPTQWLDGFAGHSKVIAVSACSSLGKKSAYSNWGQEISVCAPSNNAPPETFPSITTPLAGRGIVTTDRLGASGYSSNDYTFSFGGTSSACPLVAGVAGLVLSANPGLTAQEVKDILESTADKITDTNPDPQLGMSKGTYDINGHSEWFGFGKVNAFKAVTEAIRRKTPAPQSIFRKISTPALSIPDDHATGVNDTIHMSEPGTISSINVTVDIPHTYISDLYLSLTAPVGQTIVIQDRQGGNAHNLQKTFDHTNTPGLNTLIEQSFQGPWTLHVQDKAPKDTGVLARWELEIEGQANIPVRLEESPGIIIPDNDPQGIARTLTTTAEGLVKDVEVSLDISHTYIRDLLVTLQTPSGDSIILHARTGGSTDNIITTYTTSTTQGLLSLVDTPIAGEWKLSVVDHEAADVGKLNKWAMTIVPQPQ